MSEVLTHRKPLKHELAKHIRDVLIASPADTDFLVYEAASLLWKNKQITLTPQFAKLGIGCSPTGVPKVDVQGVDSIQIRAKQTSVTGINKSVDFIVDRLNLDQQVNFRFNLGGAERWAFGCDRTSVNDLYYYSYGGGAYVMQLAYVSGSVGFGGSPVISDGRGIHLFGKILRLGTSKTPASASDTGNAGEICWDANYIYVCVAANTWKRAALSTW